MTEGTNPVKKKCFVISPIGAKDSPERKAADQVLKHLIRKALGGQYDVERADDSNNPGEITTAMVASILEADLIVADLTGHNPNVFYEIAMAHGYNKPTVHIQKAGDKVPFDVKDMRVISYDMGDPDELEGAQKTLRDFAKYVVENPGKAETPLSSANAFAAIQESTDPAVESNVLVMDAIEKLRRDVLRAIPTRRVAASQSNAAVFRRIGADLRSSQLIINRIVDGGRADVADFEAAITTDTSKEYDDWVQAIFRVVVDSDAPDHLDVLISPDVLHVGDEDYEPDEDLFRDR